MSLQLAGFDIALPTILSIAGWQSHGGRRVRTLIGFAAGHVDAMIVPLLQQWLLQHYHRYFVENGRSLDSELAAAAFHEKVSYHFTGDGPFMAALVFPQRGAFRPSAPHLLNQHTRGRNHANARHQSAQWVSRLMGSDDLARWAFVGLARAYLHPRGDLAQVTFDHLPGAIEMIGAASGASPPESSSPQCQDALAWYGLGVPAHSPTEVMATLRNDINELRRAETSPRAA
jgi:hypothetical protein